jgi:hypothetical protein
MSAARLHRCSSVLGIYGPTYHYFIDDLGPIWNVGIYWSYMFSYEIKMISIKSMRFKQVIRCISYFFPYTYIGHVWFMPMFTTSNLRQTIDATEIVATVLVEKFGNKCLFGYVPNLPNQNSCVPHSLRLVFASWYICGMPHFYTPAVLNDNFWRQVLDEQNGRQNFSRARLQLRQPDFSSQTDP